jgi:hypothetical protein
MGEAIEVSAPRAGPAAQFRIRALGMGHFIYDAALDAPSRFAAHEFLFFYNLHKTPFWKAFYCTRVHSHSVRGIGLNFAALAKLNDLLGLGACERQNTWYFALPAEDSAEM